jgi:3-hydroxybutyryl-CoA dehydrogenase
MQNIGVIGSGLMGSGIAQVAAQSGFQVLLSDQQSEALDGALSNIKKRLERQKEKGKLEEEVDLVLDRIQTTTELSDFARLDLVIEAISEQEPLKCALFSELDKICPPTTLLASNTSSISITNIAAATQQPERVVGIHFFNPVPVMPLVEVIRGAASSDESVTAATRFAERLDKTVVQAKDTPGFVVNRLLIPFLIEAIFAFEEGIASREDIDKGVTLGLGHPMGPLTLADFVGLDTLLSICEVFYREYGDSKYRSPVLLRRYVAAGWLGRKSGKGFYDYPSGKK